MDVAADGGNFAAAEKSVVDQNLLEFDDTMMQLGSNIGRHCSDDMSDVADGLHMERFDSCQLCLLAAVGDHTRLHVGAGSELLTGFVAANCGKSCLLSLQYSVHLPKKYSQLNI